MDVTRLPPRPTGFSSLRRLVRETHPVERCEMCRTSLPAEHGHLIEISTRAVACACEPCSILFAGDVATKYRRVPRRVRFMPGFRMSEASWNELMIPINLAFFFRSSREGRVVAMYPSPAGPTESLLSLEMWDDIARANPTIDAMEPDVEALLVNRLGRAEGVESHEYYLAPIDECFKLVGLIRGHWRGLSGGAEVWLEISKFFAELQRRATIEEPRRA